MPAAPTGEPTRRTEMHEGEERKDVIRNQVLRQLGEAPGKGRVQVRPLWDHFYRVNVMIEDDLGCVRIVCSYFLETDATGTIVASTPRLGKRP